MAKNVVVIGGGIAGMAAGIYLARAGRSVTVFERRHYLGGRAVTHLRHGYRFNLGPHAFYRGGAGWSVLHELGIPVRGGTPDGNGVALLAGERFRFPGNIWSLLTTSLFPLGAKAEAARVFLRIRRIKPKPFESLTVREWIDGNASHPRVRQTLEALFRLATYCDRADLQSAAAALRQARLAMRGVIYVDEGWQRIVDAMHSAAVASGVTFVTSSRIVGVDHDSAVRGVELGGLEVETSKDTMSVLLPDPSEAEKGTRLPADIVILAVDPSTARELVPAVPWPVPKPVKVSCLDVALSRLPEPKTRFALGIDSPLYFSVHSTWAQLAPKGGALIHTAKYGGGDEYELEKLMDDMQPGWRDAVVHRRFLPSMTVSNAITEPLHTGTKRATVTTPIRGLYVAGDWVGDEGILSDAALSSARAAARVILAEP